MRWRPSATPNPRPEFDHSMTLGAAARTAESLIIWCRDPDCRHENHADAAVVARVFGAHLPVAEWRKRLVCSRCGGRDVEVLFMGRHRARHRCQRQQPDYGRKQLSARGACRGPQHVQRLRQ
jgi:hypothetical protein